VLLPPVPKPAGPLQVSCPVTNVGPLPAAWGPSTVLGGQTPGVPGLGGCPEVHVTVALPSGPVPFVHLMLPAPGPVHVGCPEPLPVHVTCPEPEPGGPPGGGGGAGEVPEDGVAGVA